MTAGNWRGIFNILQTPFDETGDLLWEDFERESDFLVRAGSHGYVWPVMASEFTVLATHERIEGMKRAVDVVAGRIPVVIGVADTSKAGAVRLAEEAARCGADAIIALPPWHTKLGSRALIEDYYATLASASGLPTMIQNTNPPMGAGLSADAIVELCVKYPLIQYVKEEKDPQGHSVTEVIEKHSPAVKGVFSGASAKFIISEHKRGVCGNMPACVLPDLDARIWDLMEEGREAEAREIHNAKIVLENAMGNMPGRARKEVLRRRGIISNTASRNAGSLVLDAYEVEELDYAMSVVEPYFVV
jgi:dihydrodipicolinate synthase/N-acetylneuraminate lyase